MAVANFYALDRLYAAVGNLANLNPVPLLVQWRATIEADNRRGVLAGLDKDGNPMVPVTYRPKNPMGWNRATQRAFLLGKNQPAHNNLTPAQYRRLTGPPLAPRGASSRVITNLLTEHGWDSGEQCWYAQGAWFDVESSKGVPFLMSHFDPVGQGSRLPQRDLRGIRPWGRDRLLNQFDSWLREQVRNAFK